MSGELLVHQAGESIVMGGRWRHRYVRRARRGDDVVHVLESKVGWSGCMWCGVKCCMW